MGPLNFATVMKVLKGNIPEENFVSQPHFVHLLFADAINADWGSENSGAAKVLDFDQAQVSRWFTGQAKLSPNIINFYKSGANGEKLCKQIEDKILPLMPDSAMAVEELYNLVLQAGNVSTEKKMELADRDAFENENDKALFITEVLCLAMQLPYEYRDNRKPQLLTSGNPSPVVVDYIFDTDVPRPCRWFLGREKELEQLHELLLDHDKVFLHGIPGIGKSELAKAYAKKHRKEYTNIIYINYPGDLRQAVINLDFADDLPNECEEDRLKKHNRFLRSLREDTLLIVDNFNVTASQDSFLDTMLKYRCRIIFTTRCRYENYITQEVFELNPDILLELVGKFYPYEEQGQGGINRIVELLHRHTFAVELAARLLAKGRMDLEELLDKLEREKAALDAEDKIGTVKDGRNRKATYYDQIHSLFSFYELSDAEQEILRCMTLVPANGISSRQFAEWMAQPNMNTINDLMEMGFIHPKNDWEILLHPMIREIAVEELKPSVRNAAVLLDELQRISLMHGLEFMNNKSVFHTIENIITTIHKDEISKYLLLLEDAFQYMEKYRYKSGMQAVVNELTAMLSDNSVGTSADRDCLLDARAVLEKNPQKQIALIQEAIRVLGEVCASNALLAANLYTNLGVLHYKIGHMDTAKTFMKQGIQLMEGYDLFKYHDSVTQIHNYASLLMDVGEAQQAYYMLLKLSRMVREHNSDQCLDYGLIQQTMGSICLVRGEADQAQVHHQRAMAIFEMVFEDEPELLEEKRQEIAQAILTSRMRNQKLLI